MLAIMDRFMLSKQKTTKGIITTPHPTATQVGLDILNQGGTSIDAMIAAGSVLSVIYPHMIGIGGDAIWLIDDGKTVETITGIGHSGKQLPVGNKIEERGPKSVATTAGALASWISALDTSKQWGSSLPLSQLMKEAIHFAENGTPISQSQAFWIKQRQALIDTLPDLKALCCKADGSLLVEGDTLIQRALSKTLQTLSQEGLESFYQGSIAESIAQGFETLKCGLTQEDLAKTTALQQHSLSVRYSNGFLHNFPPPNQGLYTLQALAMFDKLKPADLQNLSFEYYHLLIECIKASLKQRNQELGDPDFSNIDLTQNLTSTAIDSYIHNLNLDVAASNETGQPGDTVWLAATDSQGRTACLMQSLFHDFGSGCLVGDTGILWHNRAASFELINNPSNQWEPHKRPAHTLNPSCYLSDSGEKFFFGSQGGDGQPQTQMVVATQLIDFKQTPTQALHAPRFLNGRSFFDSNDNLKLEESIPSDVQKQLMEKKHKIEQIPPLSPLTGLAGVIHMDVNKNLDAAHDPRGEGNALQQSNDWIPPCPL